MEAIIFSVIAIGFFISMVILFNRIIKKLELPEIEWNDNNELPTEIRLDRNITKDVLIYDLDTKKLHIGYYSFGNDLWVFVNLPSEFFPTNFVWAYLN